MKQEKQTVISPEKIHTDETIAENLKQDIKEGRAKLFSAAEMWNLRKTFRSASDMNKRRN